jgi:DNA polymerase sigma
VKLWARRQRIHSAASGTLNAWALALMVLFHLQTRPLPLLPPLAKLMPEVKPEHKMRRNEAMVMALDDQLRERLNKW